MLGRTPLESVLSQLARTSRSDDAQTYGAPISVISAGLGHTSEEMTRVYLKDFDVSMLNQVNSIVTNLSK
jgi:integrase